MNKTHAFLKGICPLSKYGLIEFYNQTLDQPFFVSLNDVNYSSHIPEIKTNDELFFSPIAKSKVEGFSTALCLWAKLPFDGMVVTEQTVLKRIEEFKIIPFCTVHFENEIDVYWKFKKIKAELPEAYQIKPYMEKIANWFGIPFNLGEKLRLPTKQFRILTNGNEYILADFDHIPDKAQEPINNPIDPLQITPEASELVTEAPLAQDSAPIPSKEEDTIPDADIFEGDPFEDETWIKLYRKFIKNPIFKDSPSVHLWVYLLLKANHKSNRFLFNKKEITAKRGQLITGLNKISKDTGISEWRVRDRLKAFDDLSMTSTKTTNKFRIITICNYREHQDSIFKKPQAKPQATEGLISDPKPQSNHNQTSTNKNVRIKELKNGRRASKKPDADPRVREFLDFWGETHTQRKGVPYFFNFSKDGALTKRLLSTYDFQDLKQYVLAFLNGDEQGERLGFTIGVFSQP